MQRQEICRLEEKLGVELEQVRMSMAVFRATSPLHWAIQQLAKKHAE